MRGYHGVTLVAAVSALLCGCIAPDKLPWDAGGQFTPVDAQLLAAANHCVKVHNLHSRYAGAAGIGQWSIGSLGVLAGSVFMPLSKGTAATAWSGVSGAANGLQISMGEALSASVELSRQQRVARVAQAGFKDYRDANSTDKPAVAMKMALDCSVAAGLADYESLRRLSGGTPEGTIQRGVPTQVELGNEFLLPRGWRLQETKSADGNSSVHRVIKIADAEQNEEEAKAKREKEKQEEVKKEREKEKEKAAVSVPVTPAASPTAPSSEGTVTTRATRATRS
ncbi:hypothetical protein J2W25_000301 [Variovorax boronicumulans]|uniref:Lipoprotein n=1 Tax=Variovorax boronicumulans TaxID=436515 RepID=A0AAW8DPA1_9BURK|nr:hypothetical protein [Variovorax boronicumulans]MDP9876012.1 hypothetical protein [Variovorax boronicumulans]MDP9921296.1 hypothetical protein [Variovorax boronicumulans]